VTIQLILDATGVKGGAGALVEAISNIGSSGQDGVRGSFNVDSFFDISYTSNIGSSGIDGFQVDSFFDITYRISGDKGGFDTEMVSMQLRATLDDPAGGAAAIDRIRAAVSQAGGRTYYGHVTVLK